MLNILILGATALIPEPVTDMVVAALVHAMSQKALASGSPPDSASLPSNTPRPNQATAPPAPDVKALGDALVVSLKANKATPEQIRAFQNAAGIKVDGDYGPRTAGALLYFTNQAILPTKGPAKIDPYTPNV